MVLDDKLASRKHCALEPINGGFILRDLGSRNGTGIKGKPVKEAQLNYGETFTVGKTVLRVFEHTAPDIEILDSGETTLEEIGDDEEAEALEALVAEAEEEEEPLVEKISVSQEEILAKARRD